MSENEPTIKEILKVMSTLPLVWMNIMVIVSMIACITFVVGVGAIVVFAVSIVLMMISLGLQYQVAKSKIRIRELDKEVNSALKELGSLAKRSKEMEL